MSNIYDPTTNEPVHADDERPLDWRDRVAENPELSLALAFGAGLALSTVLSSSSESKSKDSGSTVWNGVKAAALGLAARQTVRYAQRHFNLPRVL